jgi:hypothetical protein
MILSQNIDIKKLVAEEGMFKGELSLYRTKSSFIPQNRVN